jgi:hypothetical protein
VPRTARVSRRTAAAAAALLLAAAPLAGCGIGLDAGTSTQTASGNGASAQQGLIAIRDLTLVEGPDGSGTGTLVMTLVNAGPQADGLTSVRMVDPPGGTAKILGSQTVAGALPLPPNSRTQVGYNSDLHVDLTGLTLRPSQFTLVELTFGTNGVARVPVMTVLPVGIYAGIAPLPAPVPGSTPVAPIPAA